MLFRSIASVVTVEDGATLGGTGILHKNVIINSGATLDNGHALTFNDGLNLQAHAANVNFLGEVITISGGILELSTATDVINISLLGAEGSWVADSTARINIFDTNAAAPNLRRIHL